MVPGDQKRICQLDGCGAALSGRRDKRYCSKKHARAAYRVTHHEAVTAHDTAYYAAHREEKLAYRTAHREHIAAHRAAHRVENADYARWYRTTTAGVLCQIRSEAKQRGNR